MRGNVSIITMTLITVGFLAGCASEPNWQHRTLRGIDADVQRESDKKYCEDQMPHELPAALYVDTGALAVYESQDGRNSGKAKGKSEAAREGSLDAIRERKARVSPRKMEAAERQGVFHECMVARGWTVKGRDDRDVAASPRGPESQTQPSRGSRPEQPGTPGSL